MGEKLWRYVKPFSYNTRQTDRQSELLYQYRASAAVCWRAIKMLDFDRLIGVDAYKDDCKSYARWLLSFAEYTWTFGFFSLPLNCRRQIIDRINGFACQLTDWQRPSAWSTLHANSLSHLGPRWVSSQTQSAKRDLTAVNWAISAVRNTGIHSSYSSKHRRASYLRTQTEIASRRKIKWHKTKR